jgi:hypothetical protein
VLVASEDSNEPADSMNTKFLASQVTVTFFKDTDSER